MLDPTTRDYIQQRLNTDDCTSNSLVDASFVDARASSLEEIEDPSEEVADEAD